MVTSFPDADNSDILRDRIDRNKFNDEKASEWSEQQKQGIENIFMRLHPVLLSNDDPPFHPDPMAIPTKEGIHHTVKENRSMLRRCLFVVSYGEPLDKVGKKKKSKKWVRLLRAGYCFRTYAAISGVTLWDLCLRYSLGSLARKEFQKMF